MNILFYRKPGYETGKILGERLKQAAPHLGIRVKVTKGGHRVSRLALQMRMTMMIRWGISENEDLDYAINTMNSAGALKNSTNKLRALKIMKEAEVMCPTVWKNAADIERFPVLGRDTYHHGGLDVVKILGSNVPALNDVSRIPKKDFYVEFIPSVHEYRVHVFDGQAIRITKKAFRGHNRGGEEIDIRDNIRNDIYGWGMRAIQLDQCPPNVVTQAINAVNALNLDFGAVDVIVSSVSQEAYVLEVNSSPRLNVVGQELYLKAICDYLELPFQREWFGFEEQQADDENGETDTLAEGEDDDQED